MPFVHVSYYLFLSFCSIKVSPFAVLLYMCIIISFFPFVASRYLLLRSFCTYMYVLLSHSFLLLHQGIYFCVPFVHVYYYLFLSFCSIKVSPFACLSYIHVCIIISFFPFVASRYLLLRAFCTCVLLSLSFLL